MSRTLLLVSMIGLASTAHADQFAKTAVSGPEAWKRYEVHGFQLGVSRAALKKQGFTCGKEPTTSCYKIVDKRCDKGRCQLKEDAIDQWFELNGAKTELDVIAVTTTETDSALAWQIKLLMSPRQLLTKDSTLGKALTAKYGDPVILEDPPQGDPVGGGRWIWWNPEIGNNGPEITVNCNGEVTQCSLVVEDEGIRSVERSKQQDLDKQKVRKNQPTKAPDL